MMLISYIHSKLDIIDYYIKCYKLDNTPYVQEKILIPGIDSNTIAYNDEYKLNEEQFEILAKQSFYQKQNVKMQK